jgi:IS5 family transposase
MEEQPKNARRAAFSAKSGPGFFDDERRRAKLTAMGDPLVRIDSIMDWEMFRPELHQLYAHERKSAAGRKAIDVVLMFKILILQRLHNLSDDQTEFLIRDRASFQCFLGLHAEHGSPDAKTIWLFKERLKESDLARDLFCRFEQHLIERGFHAQGGQIVDAVLVGVPRQRNTREENQTIKDEGVPEAWKGEPNKLAQKDLDARWTKKRGRTYYGYKNHLNVDEKSTLIREFTVSDASVHDSQTIEDVLDVEATGRGVYADSAYRSGAFEESLAQRGLQSRIHERAYRNVLLSEQQQEANREKSRSRARVEHIFGSMHASMNRGMHLRSIGSLRAQTLVGLASLTYTILRFAHLVAPRTVRNPALTLFASVERPTKP